MGARRRLDNWRRACDIGSRIGIHHRVNLACQASSRAPHILLIVIGDPGSVLVYAHDHSRLISSCNFPAPTPISGWPSSASALKFAPPAGWTLTKRLPEKPGQMCWIGEADAYGYFAQRCRACDHQM